ncbi:MAG: diguanylate cyclase [Leptolyngbya sp.]|nr:diguanylate cyclase [Leptolyngbya sp.]
MRTLARQLLDRLPLQVAVVLPFAIQVALAVGAVAYLSYRNGQSAVYVMAEQLQNELATRIVQELNGTVANPHIINQINADSLSQGSIDLISGQGESLFWQQAKIFPSTNFIYCATEADGAFLGVGRSKGGTGRILQIQEANPGTERKLYYYDITPEGRRGSLDSVGDRPYDPRQRPWYIATKAQGKPNWSEIYLDFETGLPTITANAPVFNPATGQLLGVCATDIILSEELSAFLRSLTITPGGLAFIMDSEGALVATSTPDPILASSGEENLLLQAQDSENRVIRQVAQALHAQIAPGQTSLLGVALPERFTAQIDHQPHLVRVSHFTDHLGLDWILVVVIPERDFMASIDDQNQLMVLIYLLALTLTGVSGMLVVRWVVRPIEDLNHSAQAITQGQWNQVRPIDRTDAIGQLSRSFATMAGQLRDSLTTLEQRVEERNLELTQLNQELQRLAHSDGLTQTANRRYFDAYLNQEWRRLGREQQPISLILCDADYFKPYNDTYGHQAGDDCLQQLAKVLQQAAQRPADLVARYGGEEFAIILPYTDTQGSVAVAKHIQRALVTLAIPHQAIPQQRVTLSMGIATVVPDSQQFPSALIAAADHALYQVKMSGRDAYHVADGWALFLPDITPPPDTQV